MQQLRHICIHLGIFTFLQNPEVIFTDKYQKVCQDSGTSPIQTDVAYHAVRPEQRP